MPTIKVSSISILTHVDYKSIIDKHIDTRQHPIPSPSALLAQLSGAKYFSKLNLSQAYAQLKLDNNSQKNCVITTHKGLVAFNRLPFGGGSAPAIWQKTIEQILQCINKVIIFYDDILVFGSTHGEHNAR